MSKGKRVLFLADINSVHTENWVRNLSNRGLEIGIFSLSERASDWIDQVDGVQWTSFGVGQQTTRSRKPLSKLVYFSALRQLQAFCAEFKPDLVHAHYASSYGMLARRLKFPHTVLSLWGSDVYEFPRRSPLHKLLFKRILKSMPVICSTSQDMAREAALYVNKDYIITPFGVDTDRFRPLGQKHEIFTLGTVKSLEAVYGVDRLINAYHQFRQQYTSPSRLLIYGSGSQEAALKQLVRTLQLEDSVEFVGFVRGEALVQAFNSLDVFLALSRRESFGVAALEAQSCGVPVIVSRVGGLPEVVSGESGYLVEGEDVEAAAMKMLELTDASKREIMGAAARKFVVEHFSQDVCVDRMLAVYARFWHK